METILSVQSLSKRYGRIQAVDQLSVEVKKGQLFGILGPNGSGKTTTLGMTLGLVKQDHGNFTWFGAPPSKESRKRIGSVIESPNFFPYLSAMENLKVIADIRGVRRIEIEEVLKTAGLYERRHSHFRTYSFGMKQRLALASALLGNPEVLILDEPTNGLDPQGIAHIREVILQVATLGITIILASHLLDEVQKICSHVTVLQKGKKLYSGKVSEVLAISDCLELVSDNMEKLERAIAGFPGYKSHKILDGRILAYFNGAPDSAGVNAFCHQQEIILSHLSDRKRTLEQHFLELLEDNK
ncbi:MAG: ATP-binding cassette domain-containing protein [Bacteroidota bacterium]